MYCTKRKMVWFGSNQFFLAVLAIFLGFHYTGAGANSYTPASLSYSSGDPENLYYYGVTGQGEHYTAISTENTREGLHNYRPANNYKGRHLLIFGKKEEKKEKKEKKKARRPILSIAELKSSFERYYKCLDKKNLGYTEGTLFIHTLLYQEDQSVTLKCGLW